VTAPAPQFVTAKYDNETAVTEILSYLCQAGYRSGKYTVRLDKLDHFLGADPSCRGLTPTHFVRKLHIIWRDCDMAEMRSSLATLAEVEFSNTVSVRISKAFTVQPSDEIMAQ
jgi:hypothetical protein